MRKRILADFDWKFHAGDIPYVDGVESRLFTLPVSNSSQRRIDVVLQNVRDGAGLNGEVWLL